MDDIPELCELREVGLREVWGNEASKFTPWLSQNLDQLTETLGISLSLEQREKQVGTHRADIVARIPDHGARVLIENQLEKSDLKHLGQILSYLAGLEAQIVVWIAKEFKEDHLSAIRWLNQNTSDPYAFFALRIKAFRIGSSPFAPVFEILEKPIEWDQLVTRIRKSIKVQRLQRDFWSHCISRWPVPLGLVRGYAKSRYRRWINEADLRITLFLMEDRVRVYITGNGEEAEEDVFQRISRFRDSLDEALAGSSFISDPNPRCTTEFKVNTRDRNNWDDAGDWLFEQESKYEKVLREGNIA